MVKTRCDFCWNEFRSLELTAVEILPPLKKGDSWRACPHCTARIRKAIFEEFRKYAD